MPSTCSAFLSLLFCERLGMPLNAVTSHTISIQDHRIYYLERKGQTSNSPLLILFHGFPENAHTWEALINVLPADYHIIAPDLPGYHQSDPLTDSSDYQVPSLVARMKEFVETVSQGRKAILVGHDWGGAIAWPLAAFQPDLFHKLVILNAAHPSTFTQALKTSSAQRKKSEYIKALVADDAEVVLQQTDFALLKGMLGSAMFDGAMPKNKDHKARPDSYGQRLLRSWRNTPTLSAMLNYYREMPQMAPDEHAPETELSRLRVPVLRVTLPTLVLWGRLDDAFDEGILNGLTAYVPDLRIVYHDTATHWVHREQASWAAKEITDFVT